MSFTVLFSWMLAAVALPHKFYMSHTIVEQNPRTSSVEVTMRLFTDDLERAIGGTEQLPLFLGDAAKEPAFVQHLVRDYLLQHFSISIDGIPMHLQWVGKETEADITYCYFEFTPPRSIHSIIVHNDIMLELFPDQKNTVDLRMTGWQQTLYLHKDRRTETILR